MMSAPNEPSTYPPFLRPQPTPPDTHGVVCMLEVKVNELPVGDLGGVSGRLRKLRVS